MKTLLISLLVLCSCYSMPQGLEVEDADYGITSVEEAILWTESAFVGQYPEFTDVDFLALIEQYGLRIEFVSIYENDTGRNITGYYVPEQNRIVVFIRPEWKGTKLQQYSALVLSHELLHFVADKYIGLDNADGNHEYAFLWEEYATSHNLLYWQVVEGMATSYIMDNVQ